MSLEINFSTSNGAVAQRLARGIADPKVTRSNRVRSSPFASSDEETHLFSTRRWMGMPILQVKRYGGKDST